MTQDEERIAERWTGAWSSFRAIVVTWPLGEEPDPLLEGCRLSEALEVEAERLREIVYLARDAGIDDPHPVTEYGRVARIAVERGRTRRLTFGPVATALLLDWFRDELRLGEFDPFALADRLREVEDSEPTLGLDEGILHHFFTSNLHLDLRQSLLSSLLEAGRRPEWRPHFDGEPDVWARIREDLPPS